MQLTMSCLPCSYGRVCRRKLRARLLERCRRHGVKFLAGEVFSIACEQGARASEVTLKDGSVLHSRCTAGFRFAMLACFSAMQDCLSQQSLAESQATQRAAVALA